jgi:photosystem II stability/assembly factor-like uncharacterized protein
VTTAPAPPLPEAPTTTPADDGSLEQFVPSTPTVWWAVVDGTLSPQTVVARTFDSGQHWQNVTPPIDGTNEAGATAFFLNSLVAWITPQALVTPPGQQTEDTLEPVYATADGGTSWRALGRVPNGCQLDFVDDVHGWCTVLGAASGSEAVWIYRTLDGGSTWTLVSRSAFAPGSSTPDALPVGCDKTITFTSPTLGWATSRCNGASAYLYSTDDGGLRWQEDPQIQLPNDAPVPEGEGLGVPVVDGSDAALAVQDGGQPGATAIATSTDGGHTWRSQLVPGDRQFWNVDLIDPSHWRLTNGTVLMATDDAGAHWRRWTPTVTMRGEDGVVLTLDFVSALTGWAVAGADGGPVWWTTDGGTTWQPVVIEAGPYRVQG